MNEVKLLNIGGIDQNVKDQYARDIIAPSENGLDSTSNLPVASRHYDAGEFLIGQDRLFYEALDDIEIGDTLVANVNIKATTVSDELVSLRNKSADAAIECIAPMEKTGLSSAEYKVGEYLYWDYGSNAGLYKVKVAINIGDAFVVDTNIEAAEPITKSLAGLREEFTQVNNNFGVKNLLPNKFLSKTVNGVTFQVREDGSIVANGSGTLTSGSNVYEDFELDAGTYILSGCPSGGADGVFGIVINSRTTAGQQIAADYGDGCTFTLTEKTSARIYVGYWAGYTFSGTHTFYPMLRPAYITDDTYEPYARSNSELTGEVEPMLNVLGAKNLFPSNFKSQTINGVTYQVREDGSILASASSTLTINSNIQEIFELDAGTYILSGCPSGGGDGVFGIMLKGGPTASIEVAVDYGDGCAFTLTEKTSIHVYLGYWSGYTFSGTHTFYPMIRPASIKDDTYAPYAMTNRELTKQTRNMTLVGSNNASSSSWATVTNVNAKKSLGKLVLMVASINTSEFSIIVPTSALVSAFRPSFRTGDGNSTVRCTYTSGVNGGQIQLDEFIVDGVEYNTHTNAYLTVYIFD